MTYDDRAHDIRVLLWEHAHPTLRNMDRERIAERAASLWIPMEDLREALNALPGLVLTKVDVEQRIREIREKRSGSGYPAKEIEDETFAIFAEEKARGTEFIAILGYLEEWHWGVEERLRLRREKERHERIAKEKQLAAARLRNGADCSWTAAANVIDLHCRKNGRLYRLCALKTASKHEPAFEVLRVDYLDAKRGRPVGRYRSRAEASKAMANVAWQKDDL